MDLAFGPCSLTTSMDLVHRPHFGTPRCFQKRKKSLVLTETPLVVFFFAILNICMLSLWEGLFCQHMNV